MHTIGYSGNTMNLTYHLEKNHLVIHKVFLRRVGILVGKMLIIMSYPLELL